MAELKGKVGIVTGGGTGIGRATALAMARAGAALAIGNRDAAKGEKVAAIVISTELSWVPAWTTKSGEPRPLPVILGHEFSGEIAALGTGVENADVGDVIYGLNDWYRDGAQAE